MIKRMTTALPVALGVALCAALGPVGAIGATIAPTAELSTAGDAIDEAGASDDAGTPEADASDAPDPVETDPVVPAAYERTEYVRALSGQTPAGYTVGWGGLYADESYDGTPLTLLVDGSERSFGTGLFAHAPSSIYYNDIQDYGYETFESWVGVGASARTAGKSARVVFKVIGDGEVLWQSPEMSERSDAEFVSVDISGVHVLELVAEATDRGAHPNNHAIWADAVFGKAEATPWLSATDKEFSIPDQVTPDNILEGVFARTLSGEPGPTDQPVTGSDGTLRNGREGNDLSEEVSYTTDYVAGQTGTFSITYRVVDAAGHERARTVKMVVRDQERTRLDADIDYLTTPFASFLYTGRDYLDEQGKAAFDLSVATLLAFGDNVDSYPLVTKSGERVHRVDIDLQAAGIYLSTSDAGYLTSTILDDEPRCFHVKDWGTAVTSRNGLAGTVSFFVPERYGRRDANGETYYNARLRATEENASRFLANQQDDMTDAQRLRAVLYPYADWIRYEGGGQMMDEALADGKSVCGGNARGSVYLCQRMGIKAYWVRTDSHAWSNVKLNHDDGGAGGAGLYYRIDLLARPGCFLSVDAEHEGFHGHHNAIYFDRAKGYPDMVSEGYPFAWTAWPSVALSVEDSIAVLAPEDADVFDVMRLVSSASSIYQGDLIDRVTFDDGGLAAGRTEAGFAPGLYEIVFSVSDDRGNAATGTSHVQVVSGDVVPADQDGATSGGATFERVSLWNGRCEVSYAAGIKQSEARSTTFDIAGEGYTYFDAWVGINGNVRQNIDYGMYGKIQPEVWATVRHEDGTTEEVNLYTGPVMGWYAVQEHVLVRIPDGAVALTLKNVPRGGGNNHAGWGNPRFFTGDVLDEVPVPPTISGVEDGATYSAAVTPGVADADDAALYRKELPVIVDTETGLPMTRSSIDAGAVSSITADPAWGDPVDHYRAGDEIAAEGVYTLVAANSYGQRTIVRFTIDLDAVGPGGGGDQAPGGEDNQLPGTGDDGAAGAPDEGGQPDDGDEENPLPGDGDEDAPGAPGDGTGNDGGADGGPSGGDDQQSGDDATDDGDGQAPDDGDGQKPAGDDDGTGGGPGADGLPDAGDDEKPRPDDGDDGEEEPPSSDGTTDDGVGGSTGADPDEDGSGEGTTGQDRSVKDDGAAAEDDGAPLARTSDTIALPVAMVLAAVGASAAAAGFAFRMMRRRR